MNILFIIGNGFDLNLGMKTSYRDFYDYYQSKESQSSIIIKLKEEIKSEMKNWSDLELSLGEYTKNLKSTAEFDKVFEDIVDSLAEYLQKEEDSFDFSSILRKKFFDFLSFPERSLLPADRNEIDSFKERWKNHPCGLDIITFNYTQSLEKLLGEKQKDVEINAHNRIPTRLKGLEHIHGYVNNRMILGVNDKSQISNISFRENIDVLEAIVKSDCNKSQRHNVDKKCMGQISNANLICIFGSSLGETDNLWWNMICNHLKGDCKLIIFDRCEDIDPRRAYKKARKVRDVKDMFLLKAKLTKEEKEKVGHSIFVGLNTDMFKNLVTREIVEKTLA